MPKCDFNKVAGKNYYKNYLRMTSENFEETFQLIKTTYLKKTH